MRLKLFSHTIFLTLILTGTFLAADEIKHFHDKGKMPSEFTVEVIQAENPDLTITINRSNLLQTMMGVVSMDEQINSGNAKLDGNT